jgi:DNA-binding response OmpR family regulator
MRPKKIILLVDADENDTSLLRFVIENQGRYRVVAASTTKEAKIAIWVASVDLVLCVVGKDIGEETITSVKQARPYIPMMVMVHRPETCLFIADSIISKSTTPIELLERIAVMSARKRGPRKGYQRVVVAA